jgi:hypothetical protein
VIFNAAPSESLKVKRKQLPLLLLISNCFFDGVEYYTHPPLCVILIFSVKVFVTSELVKNNRISGIVVTSCHTYALAIPVVLN